MERIKGLISLFTVVIVDRMMQVSPKDAVSNLYLWVKSGTGFNIEYLRPKHADVVGHYIFLAMMAGCIIWFFWPLIERIIKPKNNEVLLPNNSNGIIAGNFFINNKTIISSPNPEKLNLMHNHFIGNETIIKKTQDVE